MENLTKSFVKWAIISIVLALLIVLVVEYASNRFSKPDLIPSGFKLVRWCAHRGENQPCKGELANESRCFITGECLLWDLLYIKEGYCINEKTDTIDKC